MIHIVYADPIGAERLSWVQIVSYIKQKQHDLAKKSHDYANKLQETTKKYPE